MPALTRPCAVALLSHLPSDCALPVRFTTLFLPVPAGGIVGSAASHWGVDYSKGNAEAVVSDVTGYAFSGVTGGVADLSTAIDAAIVLPDTVTPAATRYLSVIAGDTPAGVLHLDAFDRNGNLLASVANATGGVTVMTIDRGTLADIASFRLSATGIHTFGVRAVTVESPVPEPATFPVLALAAGAASLARRPRHTRAGGAASSSLISSGPSGG